MRRYPKRGGQFAIIWVDLLYEDSVPATAKLLFGEIYRLADSEGYCNASNKDFMDLLGCSETTVRNLLKSLEDLGQIRMESEPNRAGKGGTHRRIFCARKLAPPDGNEVPAENCGNRKNLRGVPAENCGSTYSKSNKKNNTPLPPKEVMGRISEYAGEDKELADAILGLCLNRHEALGTKKAVKTVRTINGILKDLDEFSDGDRAAKLLMLAKAVKNNWMTVYALKPDERPRAAQTAEDDEEGIDGI